MVGAACVAEGHAWQGGGGMHGRGGMHGGECVWRGGGVHGMWSMSVQYASYWNAFLFISICDSNVET